MGGGGGGGGGQHPQTYRQKICTLYMPQKHIFRTQNISAYIHNAVSLYYLLYFGSNIYPLVIGWKSFTWLYVVSTISECWHVWHSMVYYLENYVTFYDDIFQLVHYVGNDVTAILVMNNQLPQNMSKFSGHTRARVPAMGNSRGVTATTFFNFRSLALWPVARYR